MAAWSFFCGEAGEGPTASPASAAPPNTRDRTSAKPARRMIGEEAVISIRTGGTRGNYHIPPRGSEVQNPAHRWRGRSTFTGVSRALALGLLLAATLAPSAQARDSYGLANGCYALKAAGGGLVAETSAGGYRAAGDRGEAFRMQATDLGRYLLYGKDREFLAYGSPAPVQGPVPVPTSTPSIPPPP